MKYIDKGLSEQNLVLLSAWIDRRESKQRFPDARAEKERRWWDSKQSWIRFERNPPPLQQVPCPSQYLSYLNHQQAMNAAVSGAYGLGYQQVGGLN